MKFKKIHTTNYVFFMYESGIFGGQPNIYIRVYRTKKYGYDRMFSLGAKTRVHVRFLQILLRWRKEPQSGRIWKG